MALNTDPINEEKARILYEEAGKHFDLGTYEEYLQKMQSPEKRKLLYDNISTKFDVGTYEEYESKLKKKGLSAQVGPDAAGLGSKDSGTSSGVEGAPTAEKKYEFLKYTSMGSPYYVHKESQQAAEKEKAETKRKSLVSFYDKATPIIDQDPNGYLNSYKNWATENGSLERITYLEDQARSQVEDARRGLSSVSQLVNKLQEDKRQAVLKGDIDEVSRLNKQIQAGVENLRNNRDAAEAGLKTEAGLKLHEESIGFASEMLNAKMEELLKNPDTEKKLTALHSLQKELEKSKPDAADRASVDKHNHLVEQYNSILQDEEVAKVTKIAEQGGKLVESEKTLAKKFPNEFSKRVEKKSKQEQVDAVFAGLGAKGVVGGMATQLGRSATGFVSDLLKSWTVFDHNNEFGPTDKFKNVVDSAVDYINESVFPIPSDYNKPMMYQDDNGNNVFRSDLILPKTAKVAGDMAALLFGAGKLSALGKAAGLSGKVSSGIGLFTSSYLQSHDDYKKAGEAAGLSPSEAAWFATTGAATTSALEMISPNKYLWSADDLAKTMARNIKSGMSRQQAMKESLKFVGEQMGAENLQEITQMIGDKLVETGVNQITGNNHFEHNSKDIMNEAVETMVLTSIVAGAPAGVKGAVDVASRNKNYRDAIRLAAENKEKYMPLLQNTFREMGASSVEIQKTFDAIDAVKVPKEGTPLYLVHGQTVDRAAIEKKLQKGDLSGVYVANDEALQGQLKHVLNGGKFEKTPKVEVERQDEKSADGKVKKEDPVDYAKRVAQAKINVLVKSGDLKYDGKRVTVLTDKGGQQLAMIMEEVSRAGVPKVKTKEKTAKDDPALEVAIEKLNKGKALTMEEAEMLEAIEDAPKKKAVSYQIGITSATDKTPEVKALMDEARAFAERGDFEKSEASFNKVLDIGEKKIQEDLAAVPGARITLNRTKGNFFGYTEPTFSATLEVDPEHRDAAFAAVAKSGESLFQDAIHISQVKNKLGEGEQLGVEREDGSVLEPNVDFFFDEPITNEQFKDLVKATQDEAGLAGFTLHPDKKGINLYNISKFTPHAEFGEKVEQLKKILDARGIRHVGKTSVRELRNIGKPDSGATRGYDQVRGNVSQAQEEVANPEAERIAAIMEKSKKALSSIRPDLRVVYYKGEDQGRDALKQAKSKAKLPDGAYGFYAHAQGVIGIDMSKADATTAFHESFHPLIDALKEINPELFKKLSKEAAEYKVEFEDGTSQTYAEYMGGNKEEALVEFLADFADGKFDTINEPSVAKAIKNFINQILEALGLKSKDFNINLDTIEELKDFADQLATAISGGKTINLESKAKAVKGRGKGVSGQIPGTKKKKMNRTAKRIAYDNLTQFKKLRVDIVDNPEKHMYTTQEVKKKVKDLENMTLDEVVVETQSSDKLLEALQQGNQFAVLSAIELLKRRNARGEDTRPIFKKLRELGTSVGQLLRQFGELKTRSTEGIVNTVLGNLESMNLTPTEEQTKSVTSLADEHVNALNDLDAKRVDFINDATDENFQKLKAAEERVAKSFYDLNTYTGAITPMGLDSIIPMILQGNLLVVKSIVTNVVGNLMYQPFLQSELAVGDVVKYVGNKIKGEPVANPFEMFFGATLHGMMAFGTNIPVAIRDVVRGRGAEYTSTLEVRRNLKPLLALQQIFTKSGRSMLPTNVKGKVPVSVWIEKAIEGTVGWPAEAMFRMLYLGDKPFREAARAASAYRTFAEQGGKGTTFKPGGNANFRKYMANLSANDMKKMQDDAEVATSSNQRTLSKIGDGFVQWVGRNIDIIADKTPNVAFRHATKVILKVLAKANTPFVRVPANLLQYLIELALPVIPLYASVMHAYRGDSRKSAEFFTRAATGFMLQGAVDMIYDAGLILSSGEDDDENERQLKHEVARPNGLNLTAYARWRSGGDPTFAEGDDVIEFTKLGYLGMFMAYRAEFNESVKKELGKDRAELDMMTGVIEQLNSVVGAALEMSFLQGTYNMLKSFDKGGFQEYGSELFNTLSAVAIPNNMSVISRATGDYILRAKDEEALNGFFEKQKVKIFPTLEKLGLSDGNIENVYPIIGMFGDPAMQTPKGKNPFIYHFFNITNNETITDPLALEVFNVSKRVGDIPITAPTPRVKVGLTTYRLTEQDYTYAQMVAGQYKRILLENMMARPDWKTWDDQKKKIAMETVNEGGNELAKTYMMSLVFQGIEAGKIIADEKEGTYQYTEPSEFDIKFAEEFYKDQLRPKGP